MVAENVTWGAPRIHGELRMLGFPYRSERCRVGCGRLRGVLSWRSVGRLSWKTTDKPSRFNSTRIMRYPISRMHAPLDPLFLVAVIAMRRSCHLQDTACVPFAHPIALLQILHDRAAPGGLWNFFLSTSWSIVLCNVSSATNCFNRVFSSRSCFNCRT